MSESHKYPCVEKLLKERENREKLFYICFLTLLVIGVFLLWFNTRRQEPQAIKELAQAIEKNAKAVTKLQEIKDNSNNSEQKTYKAKITNTSNATVEYTLMNESEASKIEEVPEFYTIRRDDFENSLKAVALTSRQEAAEDYHKSFSILVAMLALFGIGFPVIVAFIQHRFNERELDNIKEATKQSKDANIKAQKAIIKANSSLDENEKIKTSIWQNQYNTYREVSKIYELLSEPYTTHSGNMKIVFKEKSCLISVIYAHTILNNYQYFNSDYIRNYILSDINSDMEILKEELSNISFEDNKANIVLHYIYADIRIYKDKFDRIKNSLPEEFFDDINVTLNKIQDVLNVVTEKINASRP